MVDVLKRKGINARWSRGSGSSIYGLGAPPNEPRGWRVEINDPWDPRKNAAEVYLNDLSMSTSGSYEKFFRAEGKMYAHLMDPRTGYPGAGQCSRSRWSRPGPSTARPGPSPTSLTAALGRPCTSLKNFAFIFCEDRTEQACAWLQ